jgi:hypothetical protein
MVNEAGRGVKTTAKPESTKGSRSSPFNDVACFIVIGLSGVLFLFGRPFPSAIASGNRSYIREQRANGFLWSLICHRSSDPTSSGAAYAVFIVLGLVVGQNPIRHFLSKRIS